MSELAKVNIYHQISEERARQDAEFGGAAHNDTHTAADWISMVVKQLGKGYGHCDRRESDGYRQRLINAAALLVSAIESHDRLSQAAATATPAELWVSVCGACATLQVAAAKCRQCGALGTGLKTYVLPIRSVA